MTSETARQSLHIAMGGFALLLRWLPWWQAVVLAAGALVFNVLVLPRFGHALYRPGDRERGVHGIVFYPLAVLLLLVLFRGRPDIVARAWGSSRPATASRPSPTRVRRPTVALELARSAHRKAPPFRDRRAAPGMRFPGLVVAGAAAIPAPALVFAMVAPVAAAIVAALVETIPARLDDNCPSTLTAGPSCGSRRWCRSSNCPRPRRWPRHGCRPALALNLLVGWGATARAA